MMMGLSQASGVACVRGRWGGADRRAGVLALFAVGTMAAGLIAANPPGDPTGPAEGVRFTPGMARALAGVYTREVLKNRYQLPDDKTEAAQELVARRLMQMAHKVDEPGRDLLERFVEEQLDQQSRDEGVGGFMPPGFGREFADRVAPILPEVRQLVRDVSQDVRPMLGMKQQLKMAGDLMGFKTAVDGFEETMKKWSSGEITDYSDPFRPQRMKKKGEDGETETLKNARQGAKADVERLRADGWKSYLDKMKQLYGLDEAQVATGESILREYADREKRLIADPAWRERSYRGTLWSNLVWQLPNAYMHPARQLLEDQRAEAREPLDQLENDFKSRLERIPTSAQRRTAEVRVQNLLKEKGLQTTETKP
jgi:hypothetical protein